MKRSCNFYSQIPGFKLVNGGAATDTFTTYQIGYDYPSTYLNLELNLDTHIGDFNRRHFGRIIFHTGEVDKLYSCFKSSKEISDIVAFENEPKNAPWGERYFHLREPDGYQLSFAEPLRQKKNC